MIIVRKVSGCEKGTSAIEFALVAPVFILLVILIGQLGIFFFATAGLNNALAEGSRLATLYPRPTETQIREKINAARWGLNPDNLTILPVEWGTSNGSPYANVSMTYDVYWNLVFIKTDPLKLSRSRRVYLQPSAP